MKYGFFSDVHGDLKAVEDSIAALHDAGEILFLGDMSGGRDSQQCIDCIRSRGFTAVQGNHDTWAFETEYLPRESLSYIRSLPLFIEREEFLALHSVYEEKNGEVFFQYAQSSHECEQVFSRYPHRLIFMGHTHTSCLNQLRNGAIRYIPLRESSSVALDKGSRYIINTGIASSSVMIYDPAEETLYIRFHDREKSRRALTDDGHKDSGQSLIQRR